MVLDEIVLKGLQFFAYHGVMPEENIVGQRFIVNVRLGVDLRKPGTTDDVNDTVNYAQVYAVIKEVVEGTVKQLIEAVAETIANHVLQVFTQVQNIIVEVVKPGAPIPGIFDSVSVQIERNRANLA